MPATWTPSATPYIPDTDTPLPTFTPIFTPTPFSLASPTQTPKPSVTPKPSATPKAPFSAKVTNISSGKYHPESGCNWSGVAGIVLDKNNAPLTKAQLLLLGTLNGQAINNFGMTSLYPLIYGPAGFEIYLSSTPVDSKGTLYLQLRDQGGVPLSENIYIDTYSDCSKNMVWVEFKENR